MLMRLKEQFFTGPNTYTFKVDGPDGLPVQSITVTVDRSRYFEIDAIPHGIPIGLYAEFAKDRPLVH